MVEPEVLRATPGDRARAAADALGDEVLTSWCADLLAGRAAWGDPDLPDIGWVGGSVAFGWGSPDHLDDATRYWSRVWAARTLLYVWSDRWTPDVVADWMIRHGGSARCARRSPPAGRSAPRPRPAPTSSRPMPYPGFRAAAARVLAVTGEGEHAAALHKALDDPDETVRVAAARALSRLERRLDRDL